MVEPDTTPARGRRPVVGQAVNVGVFQRRGARVLLSVAALAAATAAIYALQTVAPVLSLGVLYVFAVLPVAIVGGLLYALPVAVASMLAFN
jgi:K+-sensing histidine kinase KdpD